MFWKRGPEKNRFAEEDMCKRRKKVPEQRLIGMFRDERTEKRCEERDRERSAKETKKRKNRCLVIIMGYIAWMPLYLSHFNN